MWIPIVVLLMLGSGYAVVSLIDKQMKKKKIAEESAKIDAKVEKLSRNAKNYKKLKNAVRGIGDVDFDDIDVTDAMLAAEIVEEFIEDDNFTQREAPYKVEPNVEPVEDTRSSYVASETTSGCSSSSSDSTSSYSSGGGCDCGGSDD